MNQKFGLHVGLSVAAFGALIGLGSDAHGQQNALAGLSIGRGDIACFV
jgi:hypothetical protein